MRRRGDDALTIDKILDAKRAAQQRINELIEARSSGSSSKPPMMGEHSFSSPIYVSEHCVERIPCQRDLSRVERLRAGLEDRVGRRRWPRWLPRVRRIEYRGCILKTPDGFIAHPSVYHKLLGLGVSRRRG